MSPNQTSRGSSATQRKIPVAPFKFTPPPVCGSLLAEEDRLETFANWPSRHISPAELAANGFYYTGDGDVARCVFCGLEVGQWVSGDSANCDHKKFSPDCDLVCGRPCGNIPLGAANMASTSSSASSSPVSSSPPSYDVCGPYGNLIKPFSGPERSCNALPSLLEDLEHLGVSRTSGPVKPRYSTVEARLQTFTNWPESCPISPQELAAAGFFSSGTDDHALCFHCGGGLKDWEEGDDPWVEHARWFSRCAFVAMQKGRQFVQSVVQNKPAVMSAEALTELLEQEGSVGEESVNEGSEATPISSSQSSQPESQKSHSSDSEGPPCNLGDMELCKICYVSARAIVFLPCGHFVSCAMCASALSTCPVCRKPFEATVRAYLS